MFHRARRFQRAAASSLNRLPDDSVLPVEQLVKPSAFATGSARPPPVSRFTCESAIPSAGPRVLATPSGLVARRYEGHTLRSRAIQLRKEKTFL